MKIYGDYHTHTFASDGRCPIFAHAKKADELGLGEIAVTDHGFASTIFHMTLRKWQKQKRQIANLKSKVNVLHGIEANLVNEKGDIDAPCEVIKDADVLIVGFHRYIGFCGEKRGGYDRKWLFENGFCSQKKRESLIDKNTRAYLLAMDKFPVDVIAHLNHRALVDVKTVCEKAQERGVYVELNEKHLNALERYAKDMIDSGVNFVVGTDAHDTKKLGKTSKIEDFIAKYDVPRDRVFGIDGKKPTFKDKKDWIENANEF